MTRVLKPRKRTGPTALRLRFYWRRVIGPPITALAWWDMPKGRPPRN